MTREEFEAKREKFNESFSNYQSKQEEREARYNEALGNGKVSGAGKFFHGVGKLLGAFFEAYNKQINKM